MTGNDSGSKPRTLLRHKYISRIKGAALSGSSGGKIKFCEGFNKSQATAVAKAFRASLRWSPDRGTHRMTPRRKGPTGALLRDLATATAECTALMNEQFAALIANDPDVARFDEKIAGAIQKRKAAMQNLLNYIQVSGW
jgi:hypothetical protein